jgi:hypothetical protein
MKILSIDVGIKNLAYCLFSMQDENNVHNYEIDSWDVIDICNEENKKFCQYEKCKYVAKYIKNNNYFCKTHAKKQDYRIPTKSSNIKFIKKRKLNEIKQFCKIENIDMQKCKLKEDYIHTIEKFINENFFHIIQDKNANNMTLVELGKNLVKKFDTIFNNHTIDIVIIENQISPIANRMKTIQGMIAQYFIMREVKNIEFVSASNKLKKHLNGKKTSYKERKKMGIDIVLNEFNKNNCIHKWNELFNKHRKKDDLADSFLQGLWYLEEQLKK